MREVRRLREEAVPSEAFGQWLEQQHVAIELHERFLLARTRDEFAERPDVSESVSRPMLK